MARWKHRWSYIKEGLCAAFFGFFAIVSLMNPHSLDGEKFNRKGAFITLLWGWPLGLICTAFAGYSLAKIYRLATQSSLILESRNEL
ncbi:MAG TPA: hypothetical protein VE954_07110 [Oligoflexus sp.]|uniref:hypothetical protein n=1 Tax=Oligoflexus sp. TaxID=1971216 RepID=UPI002D3B5633|nr:hypothetical protein [Oligoflexus sp.]HYX32866.1 hypothetical protein [Oligoflexus sp.]